MIYFTLKLVRGKTHTCIYIKRILAIICIKNIRKTNITKNIQYDYDKGKTKRQKDKQHNKTQHRKLNAYCKRIEIYAEYLYSIQSTCPPMKILLS